MLPIDALCLPSIHLLNLAIHSNPPYCLLGMTSSSRPPLPRTVSVLLLLVLLAIALASSGDRNPTFQHCLKGCSLTYCDPSQPPIPLYLRAFGWSCEGNCRYDCGHSFTDNIRAGSRWHQCEYCEFSERSEHCGFAYLGGLSRE